MLSLGTLPVCGRRAGLRSSGNPADLTANNIVLVADRDDVSDDENDAGFGTREAQTSCSASQRSASMAAWQPMPAAVMA
jgi:hypothetical protein